MHMSSDQLNDLRHSIDNIDAALLRLMAERFKTTEKIGNLKKKEQRAIADPDREQEQIERYKRIAFEAGLDVSLALRLHAFLVEEAKKDQHSIMTSS